MKDWRLEQIKQIRAYGLRAEPTALLLAIDDLLSEVATHEPASPVAQPEKCIAFQVKEELNAKLDNALGAVAQSGGEDHPASKCTDPECDQHYGPIPAPTGEPSRISFSQLREAVAAIEAEQIPWSHNHSAGSDYCPACTALPAAAEPSAELFWQTWCLTDHGKDGETVIARMMRFAEAYAAHVTKGMREQLAVIETAWTADLRQHGEEHKELRDDAAGLREQLEQVSIKTRNPKE